MKKRKLIFLLPIAAMALGACGAEKPNDDSGSQQTSGDTISLTIKNKADFELEVGSTKKLEAALKGTRGTLVWSSSDEEVATVSGAGRVAAVAEGEATISVTYGDLIDSVTVTVVPKGQSQDDDDDDDDDDIVAITPQEAISLMEQAGDGNVVQQKQKVKGVCASGSQYDSQYNQYTTGFDGVENFKVQFKDDNHILNATSPDGMEIVVEGYLEKYQGKYQLSYLPASASPTGEKFTPILVSAKSQSKILVSIEIVGTLSKTTYTEGQSYSTAGLSLKGHYDDGTEGTVSGTITLNKTTAELGDTQIIANATVGGISATAVTLNVTVNEKTQTQGGAVYTFKGESGQSQALNMSSWTSDKFMEHVEVDGSEIITGMKDQTNAYIGGNGGSGTSSWNIWDCMKIGKSNAKGEITLMLDNTIDFDTIKITAIGNRDDGTLTINDIEKKVVKKASNTDLNPVEIEYNISGEISELKLSTKEGDGNFSICITKIEFVGGEPAPQKDVKSISIEGSLTKTSYKQGEAYSANGLSVLATFTDDTTGTVQTTITFNKTTAALGDTTIIASATYQGKTATKECGVTVTEAQQEETVNYSMEFTDGTLPTGWTNKDGQAYNSKYWNFKAAGHSLTGTNLFSEQSSITVTLKAASSNSGNAPKDSIVTISGADSGGNKISGASATVTITSNANYSNAAGALEAAQEFTVTISGSGITGLVIELTTKGHNVTILGCSVVTAA